MAISFVIICLLFYFIKEQFQFNTVSKLTYYFLPIFSLFQVLLSFKLTWKNSLVLLCCIGISSLVGYYQAQKAEIREHLKPIYFYFDDHNKEKKIYKKEIAVKGGRYYLLGWVAIFAIQLVIQYLYTQSKIDLKSSLYDELLEDLSSVYRLHDFEQTSSNWYVWALYGFSNLSYLLFLCKKHPELKTVLFHTDKEIVDKS